MSSVGKYIVCRFCGHIIHVLNLRVCPSCGKSVKRYWKFKKSISDIAPLERYIDRPS